MQQDLFNQETKLDKKFREFHEENPHMYDRLVKMTKQLHSKGHRKVGMQMLFEVLRWQSMIRTTGDKYKINNDYASRYARKIMAEHPELVGIFETREIKS